MSKPHIMVVEARFYEDIAEELFKGALSALGDAGATHEGSARWAKAMAAGSSKAPGW